MKAPNAASGVLSFLGKNFKIVAAVVVAIVLVVVIDGFISADKIYAGVKVGTVDVGGLNQQQAIEKVDKYYGGRMDSGHLVIYAGEEGKAKAQAGQTEVGPEEQMSVEEVAAKTVKWDAYPADLGIQEPQNSWIQEAFSWGRTEGGFLARPLAMILGKTIDPALSFDEELFEEFGKKIDLTLGETRVDWNIKVENGEAYVTEGKDGFMVDRDKLRNAMQEAFIGSQDGTGEFIAKAEKAPIRINEKQAKSVCDVVNTAIANGATVNYEGFSWGVDNAEMGSWVSTSVKKDGNNWALIPTIKGDRARSTMLSTIRSGKKESQNVDVRFETVDGQPYVLPAQSGVIPNVTKGVDDLDATLFGADGKKTNPGQAYVALEQTQSPDRMTLNEALDYGFVEEFSNFELSYTTGPGTEAKVHNIHLMCRELDNTICKADAFWSFNDIVGDTTPEKGYQSAGTIVQGEYSESIGGGICAVATTIFNAVYNAGLPVPERHNHTMFISSYPLGRDAAISYPYMDLVWKTDGTSDVLLKMDYTDSTVVAKLYGINPHYKVSTEEGQWEEGADYRTVVKVDDSLPTGYQYIEQTGTDGSKISVTRTVKDESGQLVSSNLFASLYEPKNEVIVCGPNTEVHRRQDG